jgi:uncharacterized membrane protein
MPEISFISGFLIGFVCWISCFLLPHSMVDIFEKRSCKLNSDGRKIVIWVIFLFFVGSTILLLMLYPLFGLVFFGGVNEFYHNIILSFTSSFAGFIFLLILRYFLKRAMEKSQAAQDENGKE